MSVQKPTAAARNGRILYDERWFGATGIGRFSREVGVRLGKASALPLSGNPAGALDVIRLSLYMLFNRHDVVLSPGFNSPLVGLSRFVLTVHDLNHIDVPYNSGFLKRAYYNFVLKRACRRAARVLTVSNYSRKRIMEWSGASPEQVVVVGNGVSDGFLGARKNDVSRDPSNGYLFCVGNRKAHKNEGAAIRALAALGRYPKIRLVFSGDSSDALDELAEEFGVSGRVSFTGALSEEQLAEMYRNAAALVFPSLYEGFGLPAIEAMAVGCPVIASRTSALGEIADGAALLFDPESDAEIVECIETVVSSLDVRRELQRLGFERVKAFKWEEVARLVQHAIENGGDLGNSP
ncbi:MULTISPECIES: glycosyltransferase family 4 protein [Stenotrophomonas]|uniref:Glycosyltransferase family 1 protein n=1 Tax=Stenotrophomonas maltophilia TaxID=40324 RepID=A0A3S0JM90_STEMA|nr:glycosyltransferase family 1 protein [Stenotrophomonas maltophilia]RTQ91248.1 glycosyltransferase family 1 protein [Stenotrophomonas maltophilia]